MPPSCDRIEKLQTRNVRNTQAMRKERKTIVTYNKRVGGSGGGVKRGSGLGGNRGNMMDDCSFLSIAALK